LGFWQVRVYVGWGPLPAASSTCRCPDADGRAKILQARRAIVICPGFRVWAGACFEGGRGFAARP
jgi:hypothetical protein